MKTDAIIIAVLSVPTYLFLLSIDAFDELYAITRAHENWELDEIITLIGVAGLAAGIYAYRRILDLNGEVTKRKKAEGTANDLARHDPLTGLSNRRDFLERAQGELTNISKNRESAIFVIDLDYFKPVNDLYGHRIGDGALREVALRLKRAVNGQGVVARLGGDEFGILLTAMQNADTAERVARRIVHEIAEPIYVEALAINIGVSVGVTLINMDAQHENIVTEGHGADECVQQYLRRADMAMYKAKPKAAGASVSLKKTWTRS